MNTTTNRINPWMYAPVILRVRDVYGHLLWISKEKYDNPAKVLIPICTGTGLFRRYTQAGERDNQNMLHRSNIAAVLKEKITE